MCRGKIAVRTIAVGGWREDHSDIDTQALDIWIVAQLVVFRIAVSLQPTLNYTGVRGP